MYQVDSVSPHPVGGGGGQCLIAWSRPIMTADREMPNMALKGVSSNLPLMGLLGQKLHARAHTHTHTHTYKHSLTLLTSTLM
jgi:hypothetical protein